MDRFQETLIADEVSFRSEGYRLDFVGRSYANYLASTETETVVVPDTEHNRAINNSESENLYIVGDNLDALKHLKKSYTGRVKCIYIDPPYNTGKDDFGYNDTFQMSKEDLVSKVGLSEEEAERTLRLNGSASHSAWLSFMLPRLNIAQKLLAQDGVIFISIDDNEYADLKILCDDIFGEHNLLGTIVWKNATDNNPTQIAIEHEYILTYCANRDSIAPEWKSPESDIKEILVDKGAELAAQYLDPEELQKAYTAWYRKNKDQLGNLNRYKYIDHGGIYIGSQSVHNPGKEGYRYDVIHPITGKPTRQPLRGFRFPESSMEQLIRDGRIIFGKDENKIIELKSYVSEYQEKLPSVINLDSRLGANEISALFDKEKVFTNPKPSAIIEKIISYITGDGDLVLDFFSGSATTAHAVMNLNAGDNGTRRFIMVQLPEELDPKSSTDSVKTAYRLGYRTIDEIGRDRISRAAARIKAETNAHIDYGFKLFRLQEPSLASLSSIDTFDPDALFPNTDDYLDALATEGASGEEIVLSTWCNQDGYTLTPEITRHSLDTYELPLCQQTAYIVNPGFTSQDVVKLVEDIENNILNVTRLVYLPYTVDFTITQELKNNLKLLRNNRVITLIGRR